MRRQGSVIAALFIAVLMVAVPATAAEPQQAEGYWEYITYVDDVEIAGCNQMLTTHEESIFTGTIDGDATSQDSRIVIHCNGDVSYHGVLTFDEATVAGHTGGLVVLAIFLDRSFSAVEDIERALGVAVIGTLPLIVDDHFERKKKLRLLRWVTIILFAELAKRSYSELKQQEIFLLYYMAGAALSTPFQGLLWNQYLVQSDAARMLGVTEFIPSWVAPAPESASLVERTFFHRDWLIPILLLVGTQIIQRIDQFGLGYALFRITSDVEKLPFPMAPVAALGTMALAESTEDRQKSWKWRTKPGQCAPPAGW